MQRLNGKILYLKTAKYGLDLEPGPEPKLFQSQPQNWNRFHNTAASLFYTGTLSMSW